VRLCSTGANRRNSSRLGGDEWSMHPSSPVRQGRLATAKAQASTLIRQARSALAKGQGTDTNGPCCFSALD
jgi:hypothetical protein